MRKHIPVICGALLFIAAGAVLVLKHPGNADEAMGRGPMESTLQQDPLSEELAQALSVDIASQSDQVIKLVTETGAGEDSIEALRLLAGQAGQLSLYFEEQGDFAASAHLSTCEEIYQTLLDAYSGAISFSDGQHKLEILLGSLEGPDPYDEDTAEYRPSFSQSIEEDILFALAACSMNALHRQEQQENVVSITFAGDTTFGQYPEVPQELAFDTEFARRSCDLAFPLRAMSPYFANDSFSVLNCEGTFTDSEEMQQKKFRFKGPAEYIQMFTEGHIEVVNLANNHTFDYLGQGYLDTKQNLESYGVRYYGEQEYLVYIAGDVAFGFFGYDLFNQEPEDMRHRIERDIAAVRELGAEVIIATFHWGTEYSNEANDFQVQTAHLAVDLGADMVVGHHPHVLQGIEVYQGKTIVYSLGNFAFGGDEERKDNGDTMLVRQTFARDDSGEVHPLDLMVVPANVSTVTDRSNYVPRPLFGDDARRVLERILDFSSRLPYGAAELACLE